MFGDEFGESRVENRAREGHSKRNCCKTAISGIRLSRTVVQLRHMTCAQVSGHLFVLCCFGAHSRAYKELMITGIVIKRK